MNLFLISPYKYSQFQMLTELIASLGLSKTIKKEAD